MTNTTMPQRKYYPTSILKLDALEKAETFDIVWDKCANRWFKLEDGKWADENLGFWTSQELAKKKVRFDVRSMNAG